jgi:osmotically-inducible protein OsmY
MADQKKEFRSGWEREAETWMGGAGMRDARRRSPEGIREEVLDALADDAAIDASDIEVAVEGGDVILTGTVPTRDMKRLVETAVERIRGVVQLRSSLTAREPEPH